MSYLITEAIFKKGRVIEKIDNEKIVAGYFR